MLLAYKRAQKKIDSGELTPIVSWEIPKTLMDSHMVIRRKAAFTDALTAALILPVIFFIVGLVDLIWHQEMSFFINMIKFGLFLFILVYPLSFWSEWSKNRLIQNADKVQFGENWFLFGKVFNKWNKLNHFQGCIIHMETDIKTIAISTRGIGRGQIRQTFHIPISEDSFTEAEKIQNIFNSSQE